MSQEPNSGKKPAISKATDTPAKEEEKKTEKEVLKSEDKDSKLDEPTEEDGVGSLLKQLKKTVDRGFEEVMRSVEEVKSSIKVMEQAVAKKRSAPESGFGNMSSIQSVFTPSTKGDRRGTVIPFSPEVPTCVFCDKITLEPDEVILNCGHHYHLNCLREVHGQKKKCFICNAH